MRTIILLALLAGCARAERAAPTRDTSLLAPPATPLAVTAPRLADADSGIPPFDTMSVRFSAGGTPLVPITLPYECEGEDCQFRFPAVVCEPTVLRAAASDAAPVVARLTRGETLDMPRRDLRVTRAGVVVVRKSFVLDHALFEDEEVGPPSARDDTVRLARGDTIFLLHATAADHWRWTHRARVHEGHRFWRDASLTDGSTTDIDSTLGVARSEPETEDWWYVRSVRGAVGWWHHTGEALVSTSDMVRRHDGCPQDAAGR